MTVPVNVVNTMTSFRNDNTKEHGSSPSLGISPSEFLILLGTRYFDLLLIDVCWANYNQQKQLQYVSQQSNTTNESTTISKLNKAVHGHDITPDAVTPMTEAEKFMFRYRIPGSRYFQFLNPSNPILFPQEEEDDDDDDVSSVSMTKSTSVSSASSRSSSGSSSTSSVTSTNRIGKSNNGLSGFTSRFGSFLQKPLESVLGANATQAAPEKKEYSGNGFTNVNPTFNGSETLALKRRIGNIVIAYDEDGVDTSCHASRVAQLFHEEGTCEASYYLIGGLRAFLSAYPEFFAHPMGAHSSSIIHTTFLKTLHGLEGEYPVHDLRIHQQHLVDSVWFGKEFPHGDLPLCIVPDFLFLSSCLAASRQILLDHGITHVLRLGWGFQTHAAPGDGIQYHDFPIYDSPSEQIHHLFDETTQLIENVRLKNEKILVHCHAGVSRSSTIILAYMIKYLNMKLQDAWNEAYKIRPIIRPNTGFARALQDYEQEHFGLDQPTMDAYWMSESYLYYIEYVDVMYRIATIPKLPFPVDDLQRPVDVNGGQGMLVEDNDELIKNDSECQTPNNPPTVSTTEPASFSSKIMLDMKEE